MSIQAMNKVYRLGLHAHFDGAHLIRGHRGKCASLHGHRWDIEVVLRGEKLNELGMVIDFSEVKKAMEKITADYDHGFINEREPFNTINPTAENLARHIFERLSSSLPEHCALIHVKIWESPGQWASYGE